MGQKEPAAPAPGVLALPSLGTMLAGNSPAALLCRWDSVLRFRIGADVCSGLQSIPDAEEFPDEFPTDEPAAGYYLGEVLGVAALKLFRPWPLEAGEVVALNEMGTWLEALAESNHTMDRARLRAVGRVVEMAMCAPERLPELIARIDALGNDDLHRMAMDAVQGLRVEPDVFDGLTE